MRVECKELGVGDFVTQGPRAISGSGQGLHPITWDGAGCPESHAGGVQGKEPRAGQDSAAFEEQRSRCSATP